MKTVLDYINEACDQVAEEGQKEMLVAFLTDFLLTPIEDAEELEECFQYFQSIYKFKNNLHFTRISLTK